MICPTKIARIQKTCSQNRIFLSGMPGFWCGSKSQPKNEKKRKNFIFQKKKNNNPEKSRVQEGLLVKSVKGENSRLDRSTLNVTGGRFR